MAFRYSCFISYCHGQGDLVKSFVDQLKSALKSELDPYLDEEIYIDEERLKPGYRYNEALATAICESICMVVVYSPKYARHEYCVREFEAMARLEEERRKMLDNAAGQGALGGTGLIIPVIFRGDTKKIPSNIAQYQTSDFSQFSLSVTSPEIARHPEFSVKVQEIAKVIHEVYEKFQNNGVDPTTRCATFTLPPATNVEPWRPTFVNR